MIVPETMRAIDPEGPGGPEMLRLVERPVPKPGAGEVLIRVEAAGVNRPDVMQREEFRKVSVVRDLCVATVAGQGPDGYREALVRLKAELS